MLFTSTIAKGAGQAQIFNTLGDMTTWLSTAENAGILNKGSNLYIKAKDVPDYWIADVLEEADSETGYYYAISELETQKVDLTDYDTAIAAKLDKTGDSANNTVTFTSGDSKTATAWTDVAVATSGEKHSSLFGKISTMFKNIRYLYTLLGTTDISSIGNGSVTGAISTLNSNLKWQSIESNNSAITINSSDALEIEVLIINNSSAMIGSLNSFGIINIGILRALEVGQSRVISAGYYANATTNAFVKAKIQRTSSSYVITFVNAIIDGTEQLNNSGIAKVVHYRGKQI